MLASLLVFKKMSYTYDFPLLTVKLITSLPSSYHLETFSALRCEQAHVGETSCRRNVQLPIFPFSVKLPFTERPTISIPVLIITESYRRLP